MQINEDFLIKKIRDKDIRMRVTEEEKKQINEIAKKRGMTTSEYLRYCILLETKQNK